MQVRHSTPLDTNTAFVRQSNQTLNSIMNESSRLQKQSFTQSEQRPSYNFNRSKSPLQLNVGSRLNTRRNYEVPLVDTMDSFRRPTGYSVNTIDSVAKSPIRRVQTMNQNNVSRGDIVSSNINISKNNNTIGYNPDRSVSRGPVIIDNRRKRSRSPLDVNFAEVYSKTKNLQENKLSEYLGNSYEDFENPNGIRRSETGVRNDPGAMKMSEQARTGYSVFNQNTRNSNLVSTDQIKNGLINNRNPFESKTDLSQTQKTDTNVERNWRYDGPGNRRITNSNESKKQQISVFSKDTRASNLNDTQQMNNSRNMNGQNIMNVSHNNNRERTPIHRDVTPNIRRSIYPHEQLSPISKNRQPQVFGANPNIKQNSTNLYSKTAKSSDLNIREQLITSLKSIEDRFLVFTSFSCKCDFISLDHKSKIIRMQQHHENTWDSA